MTSRWRMPALYTVLTLVSLVWIVPVLGAAAISVLPLDESTKGWWRADVSRATLANYRRVWEGGLSGYALQGSPRSPWAPSRRTPLRGCGSGSGRSSR